MTTVLLMTFEAGYQIDRKAVPVDPIDLNNMSKFADEILFNLNQHRKSNHYWLEIQHERTAYRYYFEDGQTKPGIIYQF